MNRSVALLAASICLALSPVGCGSQPAPREVEGKLRTQVPAFVGKPGATVRGEPLLEREAVAKFYEARQYRSAWPSERSTGDLLDGIRDVDADGLKPSDYHLDAIQKLVDEQKTARDPAIQADLDILMTDAVAAIVDDMRYGRVRPASVNPAWNMDPREGAPPLETELDKVVGADRVRTALQQERPQHFIYQGLVKALADLRKIESNGGWRTIPSGPTLKAGMRNARVPALRERLQASGELEPGRSADSLRFDTSVDRAVKLFQARHRLDEDGVVGKGVLAELNVPVAARIGQVRVNLERARWVLGGLDNDFVLVNLPAFKAYLIRGGRNIWESRIVIGQEARQTPSFRATMQTVVFNPDWTVPPTILAEDVLDGMRQGKNVLAEKRLQVYDKDGNEVNPSSIDWDSASPDDFPYTLKQDPGEDNALGRVKFLFPNKYSIYLHDTPSKSLFESRKRTFSSGCIRIEHPLDLAEILLSGQDGWNRAKMDDVIAQGATTNVQLEHPIPVVIVYWTVSVGASGEVRYTRDPYDLDPPLLQALSRARRS
ncbi:MAG TPA: L,D-transpeptidase family protein [Candidatus Eisenbacteria bacterium]|jgi:murein L,D-transpeptidase YcbB/YkuD|nr:L,D-transpeptidase family protein [Candidatus Eisenbacteria bacterium]